MTFLGGFLPCTVLLFPSPSLLPLSCLVLCRGPAGVEEVKSTKKKKAQTPGAPEEVVSPFQTVVGQNSEGNWSPWPSDVVYEGASLL